MKNLNFKSLTTFVSEWTQWDTLFWVQRRGEEIEADGFRRWLISTSLGDYNHVAYMSQ